MRYPGLKTGKNLFRRLKARVYGGALILGYHRIGSPAGGLDEMDVSPENFAEQLYELRRRTHPVLLTELVQHLRDGSLPAGSVALTFDDGYADNLSVARPLLEQYDFPATVFICTGYMGKEFWWDELRRLVTSSRTDLDTLQLQAGGKKFAWHETHASPEGGEATLRQEFSRALYQFLLYLDGDDQDHAMSIIRSWSQVPSAGTSTPRALTEAELLRLADGGLIELGAHTRHHPMLPQLSPERQIEEIEGSKRDLEDLLGKPIAGFSYPNGRATAAAKQLVREAGFGYACASRQDVVRPGGDIYELPRLWQQDVDGDRFVASLNSWMNTKAN